MVEFLVLAASISELLREVKKANRHSMAVLVPVQELHELKDEWIKVECAVARTTDKKRDIRVSPILFVRPQVAGRLAQDT